MNLIQEFEKIVDSYTTKLYARAKYLINNEEDAEDLVQDVFLAAFKQYDTYQQKSTLTTWLMSILNNKVADYYRKKYKQVQEINIEHYFNKDGTWKEKQIVWEEDSEVLLDNKEFKNVFDQCIDKLPSKWNMPFKMYYLENKKTELVCQEFQISTTNLWKILQRGRLQLKECLEKNWFRL